jgi:hypothetical protein
MVEQQTANVFGHPIHVIDGHETTAAIGSHDKRVVGDIGGDNWHATRHGFQQHVRRPLMVRSQNGQVTGIVEARHIRPLSRQKQSIRYTTFPDGRPHSGVIGRRIWNPASRLPYSHAAIGGLKGLAQAHKPHVRYPIQDLARHSKEHQVVLLRFEVRHHAYDEFTVANAKSVPTFARRIWSEDIDVHSIPHEEHSVR